ncbi:MAG: Sarcosine oxidase alpha subunit, partial [uncultured Rubellimicrobium sp.]
DGGLPPDRVAGAGRLAHLHHGAVGGGRGAGAERTQGAGAPGRGAGPVGRDLPAYGGRGMHGGGVPGTAVPRVLYRRAGLRGQRPRPPRPRAVGGDPGRRSGPWHHPLRDRDDARPAGREGLHPCGAGHGRDRDAGRRGPRLGHRQAEARLRGQAVADAARHRGQGAQAACRAADRGPEDRAGGGGADRRGPERAQAHDDDRARHVVLLVRGAGPVHRHGPAGRRARPDGRGAAHPHAGPHAQGPRHRHRLRRSRRPEAQGL